MSSRLSGLQQELAEETGRLVRREAETKVLARASEGRRLQLEHLAAGQAARLPGLQADRRRLQAELSILTRARIIVKGLKAGRRETASTMKS
jgi:hypothetical protein